MTEKKTPQEILEELEEHLTAEEIKEALFEFIGMVQAKSKASMPPEAAAIIMKRSAEIQASAKYPELISQTQNFLIDLAQIAEISMVISENIAKTVFGYCMGLLISRQVKATLGEGKSVPIPEPGYKPAFTPPESEVGVWRGPPDEPKKEEDSSG